MYKITAEHVALLSQSHRAEFRVEAMYGASVTIGSVPVTSEGSLRFAADAVVQSSGSVRLANSGVSFVPRSMADPLAPFGQELRVSRVDFAGSEEFVTPIGQYRITAVTSAQTTYANFPSVLAEAGWVVELSLADRFEEIRADEFLYAESPASLSSTWAEIQRISPIPIVVAPSLPDRPIPAGLAYPESRLEAITMLMANLGGTPALTRAGALTGRLKDVWLTAKVPVFTIDGVIEMDDSFSNNIYNAVVVKSSAGDNNLVAVREITDRGNPLNVFDMGRRTYRFSSPLLTTQTAINAAAVTVLARVSAQQSKTVKVTCLPFPHLDLGDFIRVNDSSTGRVVLGEISAMSSPFDALAAMSLELIVAETR